MDEESGFVVGTVQLVFGGKSEDVRTLWAPGRGGEIEEVVWRGGREVQRHEADGGAAHGLCSLFSRPGFADVVLDAGEEVGVVIGFDDGLRKGQ